MSARRALSGLLAVVAAAAAVLSFAALRDLALACGFSPRLAWLLPVVVDAGAAAGSLVWLSGWAGAPARRFARVLALVLLASSVAANALGHGLAAYGARPAWWVVVLVSGVAPAVLGAVVHLAVLAARPGEVRETRETDPGDAVHTADVADHDDDVEVPDDELDDVRPIDWWGDPGDEVAPAGDDPGEPGDDRAAELIEQGVGRRRLAAALDISEHEARQLLARSRNGDGSAS